VLVGVLTRNPAPCQIIHSKHLTEAPFQFGAGSYRPFVSSSKRDFPQKLCVVHIHVFGFGLWSLTGPGQGEKNKGRRPSFDFPLTSPVHKASDPLWAHEHDIVLNAEAEAQTQMPEVSVTLQPQLRLRCSRICRPGLKLRDPNSLQ